MLNFLGAKCCKISGKPWQFYEFVLQYKHQSSFTLSNMVNVKSLWIFRGKGDHQSPKGKGTFSKRAWTVERSKTACNRKNGKRYFCSQSQHYIKVTCSSWKDTCHCSAWRCLSEQDSEHDGEQVTVQDKTLRIIFSFSGLLHGSPFF